MEFDFVKPAPKKKTYTNLNKITVEGGDRIVATIIDLVIFAGIIGIFLAIFFDKLIILDEWLFLFLFFAFGIIIDTIFSFLIPVYTKGQTIGKKITGIRIISNNGEYVSITQLFVRDIVYSIPSLFFGVPVLGRIMELIMGGLSFLSLYYIFNDVHHQAVHDKFAGVYVVYNHRYIMYRKERNQPML